MVSSERQISKETACGSIAENIQIVADGQTCRLLGAWIGNKASYITPWPAVLEKIENDLERWKITVPTLEGKRHIINMVIGGRTQYLTRVQGMTKDIEETLIKTEHAFLWDGKKARVAHEFMTLDIAEGGKQILDIPTLIAELQLVESTAISSLPFPSLPPLPPASPNTAISFQVSGSPESVNGPLRAVAFSYLLQEYPVFFEIGMSIPCVKTFKI